MRQTNLSLDEILNFLKNGKSPYPVCLLINELGIICRNGKDENESGEKYLVSILTERKPQYGAIAFYFLSSTPATKEKYAANLAEYYSNPENKELLPFIDQRLADLG